MKADAQSLADRSGEPYAYFRDTSGRSRCERVSGFSAPMQRELLAHGESDSWAGVTVRVCFPSPLFKATWTLRGERCEGPEELTPGLALKAVPDGARTVTVLRDSRGRDHPENAGKFFLHRIIP